MTLMGVPLQAVGLAAALVASAPIVSAAPQAKSANRSRNIPPAVNQAVQDNRPGAEGKVIKK